MKGTSLKPVWKIGVVAAVAVAVVVVLLWVISLVPNLNPFSEEIHDRSQPALLQSVRDLSQYHAAEGDFQVIVDLEHDVAWVPDVLAGSRTLFVAAGTVSAYVDFEGLTERALVVDEQKKTVRVRLPEAKLAKPNLDQERTYLYSQERGAWDRVKSLFDTPDQQEVYVLAEQKIADAAKTANLTSRAERNTRTMLTGMFTSLGYRAEFPSDRS